MVSVDEIRKAQRAEGPATVLAIGTATPPNCVDQSTYPDYYFRITNSEHKTELKEKFKRMCKLSLSTFFFFPLRLYMCIVLISSKFDLWWFGRFFSLISPLILLFVLEISSLPKLYIFTFVIKSCAQIYFPEDNMYLTTMIHRV